MCDCKTLTPFVLIANPILQRGEIIELRIADVVREGIRGWLILRQLLKVRGEVRKHGADGGILREDGQGEEVPAGLDGAGGLHGQRGEPIRRQSAQRMCDCKT